MVSTLLWEVGDEVRVCPVGFVQESSFGKILLLLCESSRTQRHLWESNGTPPLAAVETVLRKGCNMY